MNSFFAAYCYNFLEAHTRSANAFWIFIPSDSLFFHAIDQLVGWIKLIGIIQVDLVKVPLQMIKQIQSYLSRTTVLHRLKFDGFFVCEGLSNASKSSRLENTVDLLQACFHILWNIEHSGDHHAIVRGV